MRTFKQRKQMNSCDEGSNLFNRDIWKAEDIGCKPETVHGMYQLNFSRLKPQWYKHAVMRFIQFQSAIKSFSTCYSYLGRLITFGEFLSKKYPDISAEMINREVIINYITYLAKSRLGLVTRSMSLIHLRTFHGIMLQEKWLPLLKEPLIYSSDLPKNIEHIPRFIPEFVILQLQKNIHYLPVYMQYFITILLETGRRIGEICTLPLNCIEQDNQGDYFLKVYESKLKKSYLIPISDTCINAIKSQYKCVIESNLQKKHYLFPSRVRNKTPHISARYVNHALVELAKAQNIVDENGNIWKFHSHQFRHTVGTRMINSGVPQTIVQRYLGHESAEMTARYAHIHNETLKTAFNEYQEKLVDINGKIRYRQQNNSYDEAKWLQHNMMSQALPNGICALPSPQQRCPHANACLTCVNFRTHKKFLPQHQGQLEMTNQIIDSAKANGWQRQVEMNLAVKKNLENIIKNLEEE
jgi:integrase/recombinase XerD